MKEDSCGIELIARISIEFSYCLGRGYSSERMKVGACLCFPAISDEVVRADIDQYDFPSASLPIRDLLRLEIKPFFIRVGWVVVDQVPQGLVIRRSDARKIGRRHVGFSDVEQQLSIARPLRH
jgi:hypothetical protein